MRSSSPTIQGSVSVRVRRRQSTANIKAGVRFHYKISVKTFSSHRGWSRELKSQCWYTGRDLQAMREEGLQLIKSAGDNWEELLALGLEAPQRYRTRREAINNVKLTVLMEQQRSNDTGQPFSEQDLSYMSECASHSSRMEAFWRAAILASHVDAMPYGDRQHSQSAIVVNGGGMGDFGGRCMALRELEVSFEPPPTETRKRHQILRESYPINAGTCVDSDEERQTMESIETQYAPHDWYPTSMGADEYSDPMRRLGNGESSSQYGDWIALTHSNP